MRRICRNLTAVFAAVLSIIVVLSPGGYLSQVLAQAAGFIETFDGTPATPADYNNPHNWDIFIQGFNNQEAAAGSSRAQHGPNCEAPGFPYDSSNSHLMRQYTNAVFLCNGHLMTSPGLTGYGAIYMTPPAMADFSNGTAVISWDMSTLRTSSRDWIDIVLTPFNEHQLMAYNNVDNHIPPDNIHIQLGGTNVFLASQRVNGSSDVNIGGDTFTRWNDVQAAQNPPVGESAQRRDTFRITLSSTHVSMCIVGNNNPQTYTYQGHTGFCWVDANLPTPLNPSVWQNHAAVEFNHRVYNAEKACATTVDQFNIDHDANGDMNCPPDTWHWDNFQISPATPITIIKPVQDYHIGDPSPQTVTFQQPAPPNSHLEFVTFGANSQIQVSFNGGASWQPGTFQPAPIPGHDEAGEMIWMPMPTGVQSIMVRGANGFWGTYESSGFGIWSPSASAGGNIAPTATPTASPTNTPVPPTNTPRPAATNTPLPAATRTPTAAPSNGACPCTIFSGSSAPNNTSNNDTNAVELGVKFRADNAGFIAGVRFYKFANNGGTHVGSLWTSNGSLLATATFTGESASGWQQVNFNPPVAVSANTTYVASYHTSGHYAADQDFFANNGVNNGPLHALANGADGGNGVYAYGGGTMFPTNTWNSSNYWVDVVYTLATPTATPTPTVVSGTQTVTFADAQAGRPLNGQYPSGLIDWGNNNTWRVSGPWGRLTTNSLTFDRNGVNVASFTFVNPRRLVSLDAYNGDSGQSTITLSCSGQPIRMVTLAPGQLTNIATGWTGSCSRVSISSSNGWGTNFDNLRVQ
jgi:hypothetical protein